MAAGVFGVRASQRAGKWGKLLFASAIMKLLTLYDTPIEPGAEVYSTATAEDQARLVYDAFLSMVGFSPSKRIRDAAKIRTKRCSFPGEKYRDPIVRPLGTERKNKDGLNPHLVIVDELHAVSQDNGKRHLPRSRKPDQFTINRHHRCRRTID
jgi:phage terminase large subunit-like protein